MAVTITKVSGPVKESGGGVKYRLSVALDSSFTAGGEPLDLTSYLSKLHSGVVAGVDAIADAVYVFEIVGPGTTTTLTSTNVLLQVLRTAAIPAASQAAAALAEATSVDLHTIGALIIEVTGKAAITTSWA